MPEELMVKLKKNIKPCWKVCFWSALVFGLLAHLYKITNWLPNWDSYVFRYNSQSEMLSLGRWFLGLAAAPSSFYDLPFVAGFIAILLHSLGAVCIVVMFDVKKKTTAALIGAVVVTFPTVTSVLLYNYVADAYSLSFLLACVAALLLTREKPKIIISAVLIAFSVGIYQAYITVTITLLVCYLLIQACKKETEIKALLIKALKLLSSGVLGMALYYLIFTALLKVTKTSVLDYQGFGNAMSLGGIDVLGALYTAKEAILKYFFDFSEGINVFAIINLLILGVTVALYLIDVIKKKLGFAKILILLVCVVLLPIGAVALSFINSGIDYHNLMKMGFAVFYLPLILQYEKADFKNVKLNNIKMWTTLGLVAALVFNHIIVANVSYHKINMAYEKSNGILIRIADRIEQTEGVEDCDSILVLGALPDSEAYSAHLSPEITGTTDGIILRADDEVVGQSVFCSAFNDYCSKNYKFIAGEQKTKLLKKEEVRGLENWPAKNSICVIDNVIVVKLGEEK